MNFSYDLEHMNMSLRCGAYRGSEISSGNMKEKTLGSVVFMLALSASSVAGAQSTGNPSFMSADTPGLEEGKPKADFFNAQDRLFIRQATLGGRAEVDLGK